MSLKIKPFSTTGIGSLPHEDPEEGCGLLLDTCDIPFWPQLPRRGFREWMIPQCSEGMPFLRINEEKETVFVARDDSGDLDRFYESWSEDLMIPISEEYAAGLHAFLRLIEGRRLAVVKGQVTGPATFTLGLKDDQGRYVFFDEELREISLMLLQAKARWQVSVLGRNADRVIIFIDEPILSAIGSSSYLGVPTEEVIRLLKGVVDAIRAAGGIPGIHCCGRADWPVVLQSGVDILNFDAYEYFDSLEIYHESLAGFLERGGYIAWGIVPTTDVISSVDDSAVAGLLNDHLRRLSAHIPRELITNQSILTPSCGTGSREIAEAAKVFSILSGLPRTVA